MATLSQVGVTAHGAFAPAARGAAFTLREGGRSAQDTDDALLPICVDLDGTLIRTDLLLESFVAAVQRRPSVLFLAFWWLLRSGKAVLKQRLAELVDLNPALLPYNQPLLDHLTAQKQAGRELYLTTAANRRLAEAVAEHLGIFDGVLASHEYANLKGPRKLKAIRELLGGDEFLYAGNGREDLAIWRECRGAITVGLSRGTKAAVAREGIAVTTAFDAGGSRWRALVKAARVYQWSKNVLIFVPLLLAHALDAARVIPAVVAFAAFSLCASSLYVVNDLLDLEADRAHPRKRRRPFASGALSIRDGLAFVGIAMAAVVALAVWLPPAASGLLAVYAGTSLLYSLLLKRVLFLDVLILACLYTLRMLLGAASTHIALSIWTLAFSIFLFLGLALVKRLTELRRAKNQSRKGIARRAYRPVDIAMVRSFASSAFYTAVLVMALYINSADVSKLYARPEGLWFVCLLLIYWVSRILMVANRGELTDDPIVFAFRDKVSRYVGLLVAVCVAFAV